MNGVSPSANNPIFEYVQSFENDPIFKYLIPFSGSVRNNPLLGGKPIVMEMMEVQFQLIKELYQNMDGASPDAQALREAQALKDPTHPIWTHYDHFQSLADTRRVTL